MCGVFHCVECSTDLSVPLCGVLHCVGAPLCGLFYCVKCSTVWSVPLCGVLHCMECSTVLSVPLCGVFHCVDSSTVWSVPLCGALCGVLILYLYDFRMMTSEVIYRVFPFSEMQCIVTSSLVHFIIVQKIKMSRINLFLERREQITSLRMAVATSQDIITTFVQQKV